MTTDRGPLRPDDKARAVAYSLGVVWACLFPFLAHAIYSGVIVGALLVGWSVIVGGGQAVALVGALLRRDLKVELPGLYITQVGMLVYMVAQLGFAGPALLMRIPFTILLLWHSSLLWPRLVALEAFARKRHREEKEIQKLLILGDDRS